jgi:hypothetical protein
MPLLLVGSDVASISRATQIYGIITRTLRIITKVVFKLQIKIGKVGWIEVFKPGSIIIIYIYLYRFSCEINWKIYLKMHRYVNFSAACKSYLWIIDNI